MLRVLQCGVTVEVFYCNTVAENMVVIRADRLNQYREDARLRMAVYTLSLPHIKDTDRKEIYDFMPLPYDPTKAERAEMKRKADAKEEKYLKDLIKRITKK